MGGAYQDHLTSAAELVTTYEETRAGFIALALEKNDQATPFVMQAKHLRQVASKALKAEDLVGMNEIRAAVLTASGLSDKAKTHLTEQDKNEAITNLLEKFLKPAGDAFVDELVYRFLLTKGDTLGGIMRNIEGRWGQAKFAEILIAALNNGGIRYQVFASGKQGLTQVAGDVKMEEVKAISWKRDSRCRTIVFNIVLKLVTKNVDAILFDALPANNSDVRNQTPQLLLALGELKGGYDPAGADEHWKTANSALNRIRDAFSELKLSPYTFFVGAAIENAMAKEIWTQLTNGVLTNAANLNKVKQMASLSNWIISL